MEKHLESETSQQDSEFCLEGLPRSIGNQIQFEEETNHKDDICTQSEKEAELACTFFGSVTERRKCGVIAR